MSVVHTSEQLSNYPIHRHGEGGGGGLPTQKTASCTKCTQCQVELQSAQSRARVTLTLIAVGHPPSITNKCSHSWRTVCCNWTGATYGVLHHTCTHTCLHTSKVTGQPIRHKRASVCSTSWKDQHLPQAHHQAHFSFGAAARIRTRLLQHGLPPLAPPSVAGRNAQGHRKKISPSKVRSKKKGKTQKSGLCGGVEGDLCGIDSCRYVLQFIRLLIAEGGGAKSGGMAKQKSVGNVGKLTQVSLLHSAPLPALGRTWQLLPIYVAVEHGQSHSEADRKGHSLSGTTLAFQYCHRINTKGKVVWQSIKRNM